MPVATKLQSPISEHRGILGLGGNRVRVLEAPKRKSESLKKPQRPKKPVVEVSVTAVQNNVSVDSSCSSDSSSNGSLTKLASSKKMPSRCNGYKSMKIVPDGLEVSSNGSLTKLASSKKMPSRCNGYKSMKIVPDGLEVSPQISVPSKRCDWITPSSDPLYVSFHDEEWGVPVHEDTKLFELLVFSQALAELNWPEILNKRNIFRKLFDNFNPSSLSQFTEKKLLSLKVNGILLLSEPKLRAVVENAKLILEIQQEFGSFNNYIWRFVNHKPVMNGFRYARQVPVKSPKAEVISKDLMQRGFRCVGPTVIYSFMQVSGMVNNHLVACFRYQECNINVIKNSKPKTHETELPTEALERTNISND